MRYFTSDTHFGHQNILTYCARPYADVESMNDDLVRRAVDVLGAEDQLWHLGDVALGPLDESLAHLGRIPAAVTLVAGNHDRCHPSNGARGERFVAVYRERCRLTDLILTNTRLRIANGETVNVSHFPYADETLVGHEDRHGEVIADRFAPWRPVDDGSWLLCGHVHGSWRQHGRMINVGVDAWGGAPVGEDALVTLIDAGPRDLPPIPWR